MRVPRIWPYRGLKQILGQPPNAVDVAYLTCRERVLEELQELVIVNFNKQDFSILNAAFRTSFKAVLL